MPYKRFLTRLILLFTLFPLLVALSSIPLMTLFMVIYPATLAIQFISFLRSYYPVLA